MDCKGGKELLCEFTVDLVWTVKEIRSFSVSLL
jgi:hypothetical protein